MSSYTFSTKSYKESCQDFPPLIFKYRECNNEYHLRFITEKEVFMSPPSRFDDVKDCKITTRYDLLTDEEAFILGLKLASFRPSKINQIFKEAYEFVEEKNYKDPEVYQNFITYYNNNFDKSIGILCLTENPNSNHLWEDYAKNSTGFCIGYNTEIMFQFLGGGGKVIYVDELPIIKPEPIMDHKEIHHKTVFFKERKWEKEDEYRTMKSFQYPATEEDRQIKLPIEAYNCIIIGEHMENKEQFKKLIKDNLGNIPIYEQNNLPATF